VALPAEWTFPGARHLCDIYAAISSVNGRRWKCRTWKCKRKLADQTRGHKNSGHETEGPICRTICNYLRQGGYVFVGVISLFDKQRLAAIH